MIVITIYLANRHGSITKMGSPVPALRDGATQEDLDEDGKIKNTLRFKGTSFLELNPQTRPR